MTRLGRRYSPKPPLTFLALWLKVIGAWEWQTKQLSPYEGSQAGFDACARAAEADEPIACALISALGKQRMQR